MSQETWFSRALQYALNGARLAVDSERLIELNLQAEQAKEGYLEGAMNGRAITAQFLHFISD